MASPPSGKEESGDRFDFLVSPYKLCRMIAILLFLHSYLGLNLSAPTGVNLFAPYPILASYRYNRMEATILLVCHGRDEFSSWLW